MQNDAEAEPDLLIRVHYSMYIRGRVELISTRLLSYRVLKPGMFS